MLYRNIIPGSYLTWISRVALRIPTVWLVLTVLSGLVVMLAVFGKFQWKSLLCLVLAILAADMVALSIMAWGFMSPFRNVTWGVGP